MSKTGTSSDMQDDQNGGDEGAGGTPPDRAGAQQKAWERGRWVREAILKGATSGVVRGVIEESAHRLGDWASNT